HPAPASGDDAKATRGIGMTDARGWEPATDETGHAIPADSARVTATGQSAVPQPSNPIAKQHQRLGVRRDAVVTDVPADHRAQPSSYLGDGIVQALPEFELHCVQFC